MKHNQTIRAGLLSTLIVALSLSLSAAGDNSTGSVYEELQKKPQFSTLVLLLADAGLAEQINSNVNVALFAPNDDAFAALTLADPTGYAAILADPTGALANLLLYHMLAGTYPSSKFKTGSYETLSPGQSLFVSAIDFGKKNRSIQVNDSNVVAVDCQASNGFFHEIDVVLDPAYVIPPTVYGLIAADPNVTTFASLIDTAGLKKLLNGKKNLFTVFAPTDAALAPIAGDLALLNKGYLKKFVLTHIVRGEYSSADLVDGLVLEALDGSDLNVAVVAAPAPAPDPLGGPPAPPAPPAPPTMTVEGAIIVTADGDACNGVVHTIDAAILSTDITESITEAAAKAAEQAAKEAAKAAKEAQKAAAKAAKEAEKALKKAQKEAEKAQKEAEKALRKAQKEAEKAAKKAQKEAEKAAKEAAKAAP